MGQPPVPSAWNGTAAPGPGSEEPQPSESPEPGPAPEGASARQSQPVHQASPAYWPAPDQQWQQPAPDQQWQQPPPPQAQQGQQPAPDQQWHQPPPPQAQPAQWQQPAPDHQQPSGWAQPSQPPVPQAPVQAPVGYASQGQSMYGVRPEQQAPQQQGGYGQFAFPVAPKQKPEPLAVAGVATSPLGPVGLVLGLMARGRVKRSRRRSMGLAWTGVALGAVFTVGWALVITVLSMNGTIDRALERPQEGDVAQARTIAAANLAVGNCISTLPPAQEVGEVRLVPCAEEHIAQVVTLHALSGEFPGEAALADQAVSTCTADVDQIDPGDASIVPWYLVPSSAGWAQGNTQVVCLLRGDAGPLHVDLVNR